MGRTAGLRPAQTRRLERLSHRRHPESAGVDWISLQRLAAESAELDLPLSLVLDERGLCRLLWVGPLEQSGRLLERLPGGPRRQGNALRLITCVGRAKHLEPQGHEAVVGLDLQPGFWLRFGNSPQAGGRWPAAAFSPSSDPHCPWKPLEQDDLAVLCELAPPEPQQAPPARALAGQEQVLLLVLSPSDPEDARREIAELEGLVRSAGAKPLGLVVQRQSNRSGQNLWGEGKVQEAALEARRLGASLVVTDRELTPAQARTLEARLELPVSDRSELILDIFAQRAASSAGRLQVELAQLRYRLPRLAGRGLSLSRQGGGIGTRGPGETQLEKDRRAIARRIDKLQRDVQKLREHRARLRSIRRTQRRLALVGYTNAGKSSLLNALSKAPQQEAVLAENKLFATLDPTTRRIVQPNPDGGPPAHLLLTDTVGFIRDLPPPLVEAFRSTLEETLDADRLLLVVDLSDPGWSEQLSTVHAILDQLGSDVPRQLIANQIDRCPKAAIDQAKALDPQVLFVSATGGLGLEHLKRSLFA